MAFTKVLSHDSSSEKFCSAYVSSPLDPRLVKVLHSGLGAVEHLPRAYAWMDVVGWKPSFESLMKSCDESRSISRVALSIRSDRPGFLISPWWTYLTIRYTLVGTGQTSHPHETKRELMDR